ncbi:MAG: hypothetical protein RSE01_01655, partial [Akkermansia sp.]
FIAPLFLQQTTPSPIKYGSGGERVALAVGGASGSRLNRFHRPIISPTNSQPPFFSIYPAMSPPLGLR